MDAATIFFIKVMASKITPFIPAFCDGKMSIKGTHYYFSAKHRTVLFPELLCFLVFLLLFSLFLIFSLFENEYGVPSKQVFFHQSHGVKKYAFYFVQK